MRAEALNVTLTRCVVFSDDAVAVARRGSALVLVAIRRSPYLFAVMIALRPLRALLAKFPNLQTQLLTQYSLRDFFKNSVPSI